MVIFGGFSSSLSSSTDLWSVGHIFGAVSDEADGFHARVWEGGVTGKLGKALHRVLEGVDGGQEVLLKYIRYDGGGVEKKIIDWVSNANEYQSEEGGSFLKPRQGQH